MSTQSKEAIAAKHAEDFNARLRQWLGFPLTEYQYGALRQSFQSACEEAKESLEHENQELCAFINREMNMTANDPRIIELKKRIESSTAQPQRSEQEWQHKIADFVNLILHGDDEHKAWLREAGEAFMFGKPIPPSRHKRFACAYCHRGMESGVSLLRVNKLGDTPAVWVCTEHFNYEDWKPAR